MTSRLTAGASIAICGAVGAVVVLGFLNIGDSGRFLREGPAAQAQSAGAPASTGKAPRVEPAAQGGTSAAASEGVQPFVEHARLAGASKCSALLPLLGDMLTRGATYSVRSVWSDKSGDSSPIQSVVGLSYDSAYKGPAAGFLFAAPGAQSCDGAMIRVVPFPTPCDAVVPMLPAGSAEADALSGIKTYTLGDGGFSMMVPGANACTVVSIATARSSAPAAQ